MKLVWTDHALARAYERGAAWHAFRAEIDALAQHERWEVWFEFDEREDRGLQRNLVIRAADGSAAVLRVDRFEKQTHVMQRRLVVISVLTATQYERNTVFLWSPTPDAAMAKKRLLDEDKVRSGPLSHRPLADLWRRK